MGHPAGRAARFVVRHVPALMVGIGLGLGLFEILLHVNQSLLLRALVLEAPTDPPLSVQEYEITYLSADVFAWTPYLVERPAENAVEEQVRFVTDAFGFPNPPGGPPMIEVAVGGHSYTHGAHVAVSWPRALETLTGWPVMNVAQRGTDTLTNMHLLRRYALPRRPRWVILDLMNGLDVTGINPLETPFYLAMLPPQLVGPSGVPADAHIPAQPVFPIPARIGDRTLSLVLDDNGLMEITARRQDVLASANWARLTESLRGFRDELRASGACLALLYVPTKPEVYVPILDNPERLAPILPFLRVWSPGPDGWLVRATAPDPSVARLRDSADDVRLLIAAFAAENAIPLIDPTGVFRDSIRAGSDPFLRYDTHWNTHGHALTAAEVARILEAAPCPAR